VAQLGEGLKPLKGEFHVPANPVPLEENRGTKRERSKRRKDHEVVRILQRLWLEDLPVPGGVAPELFDGTFDRFLGFTDCTQTSRNDAGRSRDGDHPFANLPSLP
jgi:hypothetical protein